MPRGRGGRASAATLARLASAVRSREAVIAAMREGRSLRVSSVTDVEAGTVHAVQAVALVRRGGAAYPPNLARPGWSDRSRIVPRCSDSGCNDPMTPGSPPTCERCGGMTAR